MPPYYNMKDTTRAFFTDLDGTILFSKTGGIGSAELVAVEEHTTGTKGYFTKKEINLIEKIREVGLFIPTTTRSIEQTMRIDVINQSEYILCANGGVLLVNGEIDKAYDEYIGSLFEKYCINLEETIADIERLAQGTTEFVKKVDERFIYLKTNVPSETERFLGVLEAHFDGSNYAIWKVGYKLYVIPTFIKKETGIAYLIAKKGISFTMGAGDTLMDVGMLSLVDRSVAPEHKQFVRKVWYETEATGIRAGEEILKKVYSTFKTIL